LDGHLAVSSSPAELPVPTAYLTRAVQFSAAHRYHRPEWSEERNEALCLDIWRRLAARLPAGCTLDSVRVQEEPRLYAEYRGEG
jgi:hypothetical protein